MNIGRNHLLIFLLLTAVVIVIQFDILKPTLEIGLTPDDWGFIFSYKLLGPHPWSKITEVWAQQGPYTTVPLFYTGFINSIVGFDYLKLQIVSIVFKILATLVLFPLILIIFKNRLLAVLVTFLFAISYPATGALETAVEPTEYLGMFLMGLFLIIYFLIIQRNLLSFKWLSLAAIMLMFTVLMSVMRSYPLLVLIPLIEIYLLSKTSFIVGLKTFLLRLFFLYSPFLLVTFYKPGVILSYISIIPTVLLRVSAGNWHLLLTTLQGIGYTLPFSAHWGIFGLVSVNSMNDYLSFMLGGPTIIFGLIILFLSFVTSKKPWRFFLLTFCLNFLLEILIFFIATHYLTIPVALRMNFDAPRIYSTFFGLFILVLAFMYWNEWRIQNKKNNLLLALWVGPATSLLFIVLTWMLANETLGFGGAQDHYLMIPTVGSSIFIGSLLILVYEKAKQTGLRWFKNMILSLIIIVLITFYLLNRSLIYSYFNHANANGRAAAGQNFIQEKFKEKIKDVSLRPATLFYFDTSQLSGDGPFYTEGLLSIFPFFMHIQGNHLVDGCVEVFYDTKQKLSALIKTKKSRKGFVYRSLCVDNGTGGYREMFYKPENFYAFRIKDKDFIDIKEEVLKELGF